MFDSSDSVEKRIGQLIESIEEDFDKERDFLSSLIEEHSATRFTKLVEITNEQLAISCKYIFVRALKCTQNIYPDITMEEIVRSVIDHIEDEGIESYIEKAGLTERKNSVVKETIEELVHELKWELIR